MYLCKLLRGGAVAAAVLLGLQHDASADPVVNQGTLANGVTATGDLVPGFAVDNALGADYWTFWATTGNSVTVTVDRLDGGLDPAQFVYSGKYSLTTDVGLTNGTNDLDNGTNFIDFGDDEDPPALPGPFGDPRSVFIAPVTGWYTVAVTSFLSSGITGEDGLYDYSITVSGITGSPVPEPTLIALLACGACGVAWSRRRKSVS